MTRRNPWRILCILLILGNLAFIWGNSALPGTVSQQLSGSAMGLLGWLKELLGPMGEKLLRKAAHVAEFASLGLLLRCQFVLQGKKELYLPFLPGLLAACVDETIQRYVPGRSSSLVDVWIDLAGLTAGIILALLGQIVVRNMKKPLEEP